MEPEQAAAGAPLGMLIEPGASGSLHMILGDALIRSSLEAPLPDALLEPLWDSESGARCEPLLCPMHRPCTRVMWC
jgi:hypothetical protein